MDSSSFKTFRIIFSYDGNHYKLKKYAELKLITVQVKFKFQDS